VITVFALACGIAATTLWVQSYHAQDTVGLRCRHFCFMGRVSRGIILADVWIFRKNVPGVTDTSTFATQVGPPETIETDLNFAVLLHPDRSEVIMCDFLCRIWLLVVGGFVPSAMAIGLLLRHSWRGQRPFACV
jgi:hypothetical protein